MDDLIFSALAYGANKANDAKRAVAYATAARALQMLVLLIVLGFVLMILITRAMMSAFH